ncbi:Inositol-1,4,5-trisphosphate 5-phosphatase 1 [Batrachochytrium dendrobatidis]|nr:Inositol-1,4,5-trisphosphate 5-phosphatase 1 [Batrachochytrium dendrobatidis]KAK5670960.1 Inositol-1,4,5-trisphosphate 5-phosphatase 1 [Batrachochytrium dendrobatidis]
MATTTILYKDYPTRTVVVRPPANFSTTCIVFTSQQTNRGLCSSMLLQPAETIDFASLKPLLPFPVYGCLGTVTIENDIFISLVLETEMVGLLNGQPIYRILKTSFFSLLSNKYDRLNLDPPVSTGVFMDEASSVIHPCQSLIKLLSYGSFYYSPTFDLTHRMEERLSSFFESQLSESSNITTEVESVLDTMDLNYVWNRNMLRQLMQIREQELSPSARKEFDMGGHVLAIIQGFVGLTNVSSSSGKWQFGIISRMGCNRAGTRFNARGINDDGYVSNFVETEFLMLNEKYWTSFLQIRGSVPVFWEQIGVQVSHKVILSRGPESALPAATKHFQELVRLYSAVNVVNLLSQSPTSAEYALNESYRTAVLSLPKEISTGVIYSTFDFHAIVKRDQYERLDNLLDQVRSSIDSFGYSIFDHQEKTVVFRQSGVFRTNCLDCLDRTNVVQTFFARHMLDLHLEKFNIRLNSTDVENWNNAFNGLWADNGDWLSRIYAGTGALKSSYTRKGKQTMLGFLDDAAKSVNRFYVSNFQDKAKQEAINLLFSQGPATSSLLLQNPAYDIAERQMQARLYEYAKPSELNILLRTYNLHGKMPSIEALMTWLNPTYTVLPDIIVIGVQELIELTPDRYISTDTNLLRFQLEAKLLTALNSKPSVKYVVLRSIHLVALGLFVFVKPEITHHIKKLETATVKTGLGGMAANKGGVGLSIAYHDTSMVFITAHLAAGTLAVEERNRDYWTITNGLVFRGKRLHDHDMVFWLGDFNYRIDLPNEQVRKCIQNKELLFLSTHDQLSKQIQMGLAFTKYIEGPLSFEPTYKYDTWSTNYDTSEKARTPSWTDRILFKGNNIQLKEYTRGELQMSDHRPVHAILLVQVNEIDFQTFNAIHTGLLQQLFAGNTKVEPQLSGLKKEVISTNVSPTAFDIQAEKNPNSATAVTGTLIDLSHDQDVSTVLVAPILNPFTSSDPFLWNNPLGPLPPPSSDAAKWWELPLITSAGFRSGVQSSCLGQSLLD